MEWVGPSDASLQGYMSAQLTARHSSVKLSKRSWSIPDRWMTDGDIGRAEQSPDRRMGHGIRDMKRASCILDSRLKSEFYTAPPVTI